MESSRGILFLALAFISFLLFQQWQTDYAPKQTTADSSINHQPMSDVHSDIAQIDSYTPSDLPVSDIPSAEPQSQKAVTNQLLKLENAVLLLKVDPKGGDVVFAQLKQFNQELNSEDRKIQILEETANSLFVAKSGLLGKGAPDSEKERALYQVIDHSDSILKLSWVNSEGVEFIKQFEIAENSYQINVSYQINNQSNTANQVRLFTQLNRDRNVQASNMGGFGVQAYTGAAYSSEETRYEKYDFDDMDDANLNIKTKGGWVAYLQHYFVTAWIPDQNLMNELSSQVLNDQFKTSLVRVIQPWVEIGAKASKEINTVLYIGPKDQDVLANIAPNLDLVVDYGIFWWIGQPIFWLLTLFQGWVFNWGLAIILVTVTVKIILYPLANAQYRSFAKMRMLQPKMQELKDRYGEDRQKMSMAMMEMYKKEKVNPMGGCLPLLVQMPVFFALYWVLLESFEIRHAPFAFWITDLSAADPFYILPILMGISMWAMQKMQPTSAAMDPMQQKIMQYLPVMMTVFFIFFPSGLVLYWLVNNLLSIAQQVYITRKVEKEYATKKA